MPSKNDYPTLLRTSVTHLDASYAISFSLSLFLTFLLSLFLFSFSLSLLISFIPFSPLPPPPKKRFNQLIMLSDLSLLMNLTILELNGNKMPHVFFSFLLFFISLIFYFFKSLLFFLFLTHHQKTKPNTTGVCFNWSFGKFNRIINYWESSGNCFQKYSKLQKT